MKLLITILIVLSVGLIAADTGTLWNAARLGAVASLTIGTCLFSFLAMLFAEDSLKPYQGVAEVDMYPEDLARMAGACIIVAISCAVGLVWAVWG